MSSSQVDWAAGEVPDECLPEHIDSDWPEPEPLPPSLPSVMAFNQDLLPEAFRCLVIDIAERMQCPIDFPAISVVTVFSALIGRQIAIRPKRQDSWSVVPNLWALAIGRPGVMKSPAINGPLKIVRQMEIEESRRFAEDRKVFEHRQEIAKQRKTVQSNALKKAIREGKSDAEIMAAYPAESLEEPKRRRFLVNDSTVEKLGEILQASPNGILLERDEIYSFLKTMDKPGHEADRGFYLTAWDGDKRYVYDRIMRGETVINGAAVSIIGTIQPGRLQTYVRGALEGGAADDGLLQRFQLAVWPDCSADWENVDRWPDTDAQDAILQIAEQLRNMRWDGATPDEYDALPYVRFTDDAQYLFDDWRRDLEYRLRDDSLPPHLESHFSKYRSLIPSLALIFHVVDSAGGDVGKAALVRAIHWGRYLESHAQRIYAAGAGSTHAAKALAGRLLDGSLESGFTKRAIQRNGWSGLTTRDAVEQAVEDLTERAWLAVREEKNASNRTVFTFDINPRIF